MKLAASGLYTFFVDKKARKPEIAKVVAEKFGVEVVAVKTISHKEEKKSQRRWRGFYTLPGYKKALVQLKNGQKINLFETETGTPEELEAPKEVKVKEKKSLLKGTKVRIEKGEKA